MPRSVRLDWTDALHHVMSRGIEKRDIFLDDLDRIDFIFRLARIVKTTGIKIYAWVLMPNHFHLLVRTGPVTLSRSMQKLLTGYAMYFNKRHNRKGHLFQNRFKSILVQEELYFLNLLAYIHLNPARKQIVSSREELDWYPWSGHSAIIGRSNWSWQNTGSVLKRFGKQKYEAIEKYSEYISDMYNIEPDKSLSEGKFILSSNGFIPATGSGFKSVRWALKDRILGDSDFILKVLGEIEQSRKAEIIEHEEIQIKIEKLFKISEKYWDVTKSVLKGGRKGGKITEARSVIAFSLVINLGLNLTETGKILGMSKSGVSKALKKGKIIIEANRKLQSEIIV